jgi:3',5'-cyclic AMP phosphodiesterase CpdA
MRERSLIAQAAMLAALLVACTGSSVPASPSAQPSSPDATPSAAGIPAPSSAESVRVLAAGDIASCDSEGDETTAAMLDVLPGTILALGDLAYEAGSADEFATCYDPSWGRHRDRTWPVPGNHEYGTAGAAPYFDYFGTRAGPRSEGWYGFDLGGWHVIGLNSNCAEVGGCGPGSNQLTWLEADLATHHARCTLAFWHHPRWSSGSEHGSDDRTDALWRVLDSAGADLVLSGHDHQYERFVPMEVDGSADPTGMVQFVVGTGGRSRYAFGPILPTSAAHDDSSYGVLALTLYPTGYGWAFVPAAPTDFVDAGTAECQ